MPKVQPKQSQAWKYFKIQNGKAVCQIGSCGSKLAWHGATTSLLYHIGTLHRDINLDPEESVPFSSIRDESNNSLANCAVNQSSHRRVLFTEQCSQEIDRALCKWLEECELPACIVEDPRFKSLLNVLEPKYRIPSEKDVYLMVKEKDKMEQNILKKMIDSQCNTSKFTLCVTVLRDSKEKICLSVYFLSDTWEMKSFKIGTVTLAQLGESADIVEWLKVKTQEAHIRPSSVVAIVHDDTHKVAIAASKLGEILQCPSVLSATSSLCSVVADVWEHALTPSTVWSITKIKETISIFDNHRLGSIVLKMLPQGENSTSASTVNPDETFQKMEDEECGDPETINGNWNILKIIINALQPIEAVIKFLCNEKKFAVASSNPVLFTGLKKKLEDEIASDVEKNNPYQLDEFKNNLKSRLLESLEKFISFKAGDVTVFAAALDPRFKDLKFLSSHEIKGAYHDLINECYRVHSEDFEQDHSTTTGSSTRNDDLKNSNLFVNILPDRRSECSENRENISPNDTKILKGKIRIELGNFWGEERPQNDLCPLRWWSENQHKYPLLAVLARSYLSVPASTGNCDLNALVRNVLSRGL